MKKGMYDLEGNTVEYDGEVAYDLDSREEIDLDYLEVMGDYIRPFEEGDF